MSAVLTTIVPVFGLIIVGYLAGRTGYVGEAGIKGLPEFVFRLAMPVMLFRTIGTATLPDIASFDILIAFFGSAAVTWVLATVGTWLLLGRGQSDGAAFGMASTFSNSVMMGIPICLSFFGPKAAPYLALIILTDTATLWLAATMHLSLSEGSQDRGVMRAVRDLFWRLATNPVIAGCLLGLLWKLSGLTMPDLADKMITMLAGAAIPGALVAMGLTLNSYGLKGLGGPVWFIAMLKLVVMPAVAYVLAHHVLRLPPLAAGVVTLLAAMPTGSNAYLFAASYDRQAAAVSGAIALTTLLAVITLSLLLLILGGP